MAIDSGLELAWRQIEYARCYTLGLLKDLSEEDWYLFPGGCQTSVGWQVGHLAMAQYGLCLFRQRGRRPDDLGLMSSPFRKRYSRGSKPSDDPDGNASQAEIRQVLSRVHEQVQLEMPMWSEQELASPIDEPHAVYATRLGALYFCSLHEMVHAGQIGILRRLMGRDPIR